MKTIDIYIKPSQDKINPMALQDIIDLVSEEDKQEVIDVLKEYYIVFEE